MFKKGLLLSILLLSLKSHAFTLNSNFNAKYSDSKIPIRIGLTSTPCTNLTGITEADIEEITKEAVSQYWNTVITSNIHLYVSGSENIDDTYRTGTSTTIPNLTGITIVCNDDSSGLFNGNPSVLAATSLNNISGDKIQGSTIFLNDMPGSVLAGQSRDSLKAIIAHEIGHAVGIGHSNNKDSLMYFQNLTSRAYLGQDDVDAISYLYPQNVTNSCGAVPIAPSKGNSSKSFSLSMLLGLLLVLATRIKKFY